jgi:ECF sigma factor
VASFLLKWLLICEGVLFPLVQSSDITKGAIIRLFRFNFHSGEVFKVTPSPKSISQLLIEWREGNETALDELMPLVYEELRRMAHRYMHGERAGHTLQTTALANELYLRFADLKGMGWQNRAHFYAVAAQAMRRILIDHARKHLLALDEALNELEACDPRKSQIVVLKYFGGMTDKDTAEVLGISTATVTREWNAAKLYLLKTLTQNA